MSDFDQRTDEWVSHRLGLCGCSRLGDVLATGRGGAPSSTRKNYMAELLCERLTGKHNPGFTSKEMEWGVSQEPVARSEYEARNGVMVQEIGGMMHPEINGWWGSPDGLCGDDGGIEIKCLNTMNHLDVMMSGNIDRRYFLQITGYVTIFNRQWWDYVGFDPRLPKNLQLYVKRFYRDDLPIDEVTDGVVKFLEELDALETKVRGLNA